MSVKFENEEKESDQEMVHMFTSVFVKVEVTGSEKSENDYNESPEKIFKSEKETSASDEEGDDESKDKNYTPTSVRIDSHDENVRNTRRGRSKQLCYCDLCDYKTNYKNCLEMHMLGHSDEMKFSCEMCGYITKYPTSLRRHMIVNHQTAVDKDEKPINKYKCDHCDYSTPYKWNLNGHKRKHKPEKQYKCTLCSFETAYKHNLFKHNKIHAEPMVFKCDKCPFVTKFEGHITRHLSQIHKEITYTSNQCEFCDFSTKEKWRLNIHKQRSLKTEKMHCVFCDFETDYKCQYKKHKMTHPPPIRYIAPPVETENNLDNVAKDAKKLSKVRSEQEQSEPIVDFNVDRTENEMNNHNIPPLLHELTKENLAKFNDFLSKTSTCVVANSGSDANRIDNVTGYLNSIDNENHDGLEHYPNNHDTCLDANESNNIDYNNADNSNKTYNEENQKKIRGRKPNRTNLDPNYVNWHKIKILESSDPERPFQCHMCNYTSKFKAAVQRHFQRHHTGNDIRPYKCLNCDFSTKTNDQIVLHNKRSKSDSELICNVCSFKTVYKCQLVMHQKEHYRFRCQTCNYSCRHNHELQRHFASVHLGKGLKCRFCDYKSVRKESLLCHETIHTGNKPFKCDECDYTSVRRALLNNHVRRYHTADKELTVISKDKIETLKVPLNLVKDELEIRDDKFK